jgi:DNA-binding IclR family transcriptional regulator
MSKSATDKDHQFASTLANGIDLLLCFRPGEDWLANKDLAERTRMSRPGVARLTHTLTLLGYLRHDAQLGRYALGAAVLSISHPLLASMRIRPLARPLMEALAREIRGAVSLGVRHLTHMVYVESARHDEYVLFPDIGAPLPILSTAMGRAWLACAPAAQRRAVLNQIRVHQPQEYERHHAGAEAATIDYARHGYCSSRAEWQAGSHGFAVPLQGLVDNMQFVVNCGVLAEGGAFARLRRDVAPQLVTLARSIEVMLGLH